ncbi:hypothetical protein HC251_24250 [Iamia sp. SCSIO 61187]|uniref:hypothetical protein n=1 Tax=Iamia sp. SCSIO 61187 TaxID=2722752 RepID=UPI001C625D03|nr:hypothetical protein [Iamia sp. SCSIO 61187]QYG95234.1 hypothetical protein HC251_24250 [Iamia sp. SCSIO 61187]
MPTTTSPWASPSSPAGRRLLLTEPATLDAVPVLDDATFAALAQTAAEPLPASSAATPASPAATPSSPGVARRTAIRWRFDVRRPPVSPPRCAVAAARARSSQRLDRRVARRLALGAAAAVALLVLVAPAMAAGPGGAARSEGVAVAPLGLGRVVGQAVASTHPVAEGGAPPPADAGDVVVALVQPTETLRATPAVRAPAADLGARLGAAVVLAAG